MEHLQQKSYALDNVHQEVPSKQKGRETRNNRLIQKLWAFVGLLSFALGCIGAVLPIIPTTPFILVAAFCFARSSKRLNDWFKQTKLYKKVLEGFATKRTMTVKAKLTILVPVTVLLSIAFFMMGTAPIGQAAVALVWIAHVIYFGFLVKTEHQSNLLQAEESNRFQPEE